MAEEVKGRIEEGDWWLVAAQQQHALLISSVLTLPRHQCSSSHRSTNSTPATRSTHWPQSYFLLARQSGAANSWLVFSLLPGVKCYKFSARCTISHAPEALVPDVCSECSGVSDLWLGLGRAGQAVRSAADCNLATCVDTVMSEDGSIVYMPQEDRYSLKGRTCGIFSPNSFSLLKPSKYLQKRDYIMQLVVLTILVRVEHWLLDYNWN